MKNDVAAAPLTGLAALFRRASLNQKVTFLIGLATAIVCIANIALGYRSTDTITRTSSIRFAETSLAGLSYRSAGALRFGDAKAIQQFVDQLREMAGPDLRLVVVTGPDGAVMVTAGEAPDAAVGTVTEAARQATSAVTEPLPSGEFITTMKVSSPDGKNRVGGISTLWSTQEALAIAHDGDVLNWVIAGGIFIAMLGISGWVLQVSLSRPMRALGATLDHVAQGNYDQRVEGTDRQDDLGFMARQIDNLRLKLHEAQQHEAARREEQSRRIADLEEQNQVVAGLRDALGALARQDLTKHLDRVFPAAYEPLRHDYNSVLKALTEIILQALRTANEMVNGTEKLAASAEELAQRSEGQAATLEETAASIAEIVSAVQSSASNADSAAVVVRDTEDRARQCEEIVRGAVDAMTMVEAGASEIAQIISMIEDIAFQTNLLALNASVEAARAGDSGRGFSVVAAEVRTLAQRSSAAAQQIKGLIDTSAVQVDNGVKLVRKAGETMSGFAVQISTISNLVASIAHSSGEQARSMAEINSGVSMLDQVTQRNAAMSQDTSSSVQQLRHQADQLLNSLSRFAIEPGKAQFRHAAE
ncbi:methyl-accepting chemotaxis protein [Gemmobacter denitrificans]|uniref:Methyl-accepting chemotaxis protein n=1 Tax=Gemmobacter denitrificans TaxID=3123040 RepID=A0ABU8BTD7_9RHOB